MQNIQIVKANGDIVRFERSKLVRSLLKAGARSKQAHQIADSIEAEIVDGMNSKMIYQKAFGLLKKAHRPIAAKYKLKKAILELGPSGYPFEKFISHLLLAQGYKTKVGVFIQGKCVVHEVDVLAEKNNTLLMCECKYHNRSGKKSNVKVPLYIHSRFRDIEFQWLKDNKAKTKKHEGWIFTNTRFSDDAEQFGKCSGLHLVSWDYPAGNSLKEQVDSTGSYPITCMTQLTKHEKQILLEKNMVLCFDICKNPHVLNQIGVKKTRANRILKEAMGICNSDT